MLLHRIQSHRRRGAILLIVLTLLALFAVIGLSFALYAESEATAARTRRETGATNDTVPDLQALAGLALGKFMYASGDTGSDLLSSFRGYEMDRAVYGRGGAGSIPYNGMGTVSQTLVLPTSAGGSFNMDRRSVVNYTAQRYRDTAGTALTSIYRYGPPNNGPSVPGMVSGNLVVVDPENLEAHDNTGKAGVRTGANAATEALPAHYVGRNRPWTYPDRHDIYLAVQDTTTGQITLPSFHRPQLFGSLGSSNANWTNDAGRYAILRPRPDDQKFNAGDGRGYVTDFPYPPANPDGTITGDVQNISGTKGMQKNDAIWMFPNLPVVEFRGRRATPLIAMTVLPLDGRVNLNASGNTRGVNVTTGAADNSHSSHHGLNATEINPAKVLNTTTGPADLLAMLQTRYVGNSTAPNPRSTGRASQSYASSTPPDYAKINFDGGGWTTAETAPLLATGLSGTNSEPVYGTSYGNGTGEGANHPTLFNPYQWNSFTSPGRLFSFTDHRRTTVRYTGKTSDYRSPYFGNPAPTSLSGTAFNDPASQSRALVTTISNSLKRAGLQPMYRDYSAPNLNYDPTTGQFTDGRQAIDKVFAWHAPATGAVMTYPVTSGSSSDYGTVANLRASGTTSSFASIYANLGPVNLNRDLVDYRGAATGPLTNTNVTTGYQAAGTDRQTFARDIFARLIVATGAKGIVDSGTGAITLPQWYDAAPTATAGYTAPGYYLRVTPSTAPPDFMIPTSLAEYAALRQLAQMAANMVDLIDNDDINTTFVWNPNVLVTVVPTPPPVVVIPAQLNLYTSDATNLFAKANFDPPASATGNGGYTDRVVYGVEKPRVVLNEVYAEATNNKGDTGASANNDFEVRFWLEFLNPTNTITDATAPIGDAPLAIGGSHSAYKIQVVKNGAQVRDMLFNPSFAAVPGTSENQWRNNTGRLTGLLPGNDIQIEALLPTTANLSLEPNNGSTTPATSTGFRVVGPDPTNVTGNMASAANEFIPDTSAAPYMTKLIPVPLTAPLTVGTVSPTLAYAETKRKPSMIDGAYFTSLSDHAVVLRRLANPYLPANDPQDPTYSYNAANPINPYITVDVFSDVKARDAIRVGEMEMTDGMRPQGGGVAMEMAGTRALRGRKAPHYANRGAAFANSFVTDQTTAGGPNGQLITFFSHNDAFLTGTVQWLAHLDRKLVNQGEAIFAAGCQPHELTFKFANATTSQYQQHLASWTSASAPLFRALELLTVKPWGDTVPEGGRMPGRININVINDINVLTALLDRRGSNSFTDANVTNLWNTLFQSPTADSANASYIAYARTKDTQPGPTFDELVPNTYVNDTTAPVTYIDNGITKGADRPIKPFGVASFVAPASLGAALTAATPAASRTFPILRSGLEDTLFRTGSTASTPAVFTGAATDHPYLRTEMLRKMMNNITTTSDTFLVVMTIGMFEVRNTGPYSPTNPPVLGKELYNEVPGDFRAKFTAVLDRSMIAIDPAAATKQAQDFYESELVRLTPCTAPAVANVGQQVLQFRANEATRDAGGNVTTLTLYYEGRSFQIAAGTRLVLGYGNNQEVVTVVSKTKTIAGVPYACLGGDTDGAADNEIEIDGFAQSTGIATVTVSGVGKPHYSGERVGNTAHGSPGQQLDFNPMDPRFKGVVPYFEQVEIGK